MEFLKRNWKTFILFIIGPLFGSFFGYWYFQLRPEQGAIISPAEVGIGLTISLAVSYLGSFLGLTITISENQHKVNEKIDATKREFVLKQKEMLKTRVKIVELTGAEVDKTITDKIKSGKNVKNTLINLADRMSKVPGAEEVVISQYDEFLSRDGGLWSDITTIQDIKSGRFKKISPKRIGSSTRHEIALIPSTTNTINFLMIESYNQDVDLFFGWVDEVGDVFRVFWTNDSAMILLFTNHYRLLKSHLIE
ncbi:MAG: hypothetical protein AAFR84_21445, partial [Pseudomonadota bacterium]